MKQIIIKACWECPCMQIDKMCKRYHFFVENTTYIDPRCELKEYKEVKNNG